MRRDAFGFIYGWVLIFWSMALQAEAPEAPPPPRVSESEEIVITGGRESGGEQPAGDRIIEEVVVIQRPDALIEEHRRNGRVFMVKVRPRLGPPYYLVDHDGDGYLETRHPLDPGLLLPQWVLFRW